MAEEFNDAKYQAEVAELEALDKAPAGKRMKGMLKYTGPAFMEAATTLGAGSFASACTMGAVYGYKMLWVPFYSYLLGMGMLALATRFAIFGKGGMDVITAQNKYHNKAVGSVATGLIACWLGYVTFSFGQYALGSDAIEHMFKLFDINFPRQINWILILGLSLPFALQYGKNDKLIRMVENFMKILIGTMLITFGVVLVNTGVDFGAMIRGLLIPTLPSGMEGITMAIASLIAVIAVGDWCQFHYAEKMRRYTPVHRRLANFDMVVGGLIPVTLVLAFVGVAFAETFAGGSFPESTYELSNALVAAVPSRLIQVGFYLGVIALVVSTMIGMSTIAAQSLCRALGKPIDYDSKLWKFGIIFTQVGVGGAFFGKPMWAVIIVSGAQSLLCWVSGSSWYLLSNDKRYLGDHVTKKYWFNLAVLGTVVLLNMVFVTFVLTEMGVWS